MRERGVQSRRVRESKEQSRGPAPTSGTNAWQIIAIIALLAATAGWTTVAVIALRPDSSAIVTPTDPTDPEASDGASAVPVGDSHDAAALEAALPSSVAGVNLQLQSVTGDQLMGDDPWSTTVTSFLTSVGKTPPDLKWAQAYDPNDSLNGSFEAYQLDDADPAKLQETLIAAWKTDYPDLKLSDVTIGGQDMVRIDVNVEEQASSSFLFVRNGILYNFTTDDQELVASAVTALPAPGASARPASSASAAPAASASASAAP